MLAVSAGVIFFVCGFADRLPKATFVNGTDVGGKTRIQAAETVRGEIVSGLKERSLTVCGKRGKYVFSYPEIGYKDNLQKLLKTVKKSGSYTAEVSYYLNGLQEIASNICADESIPAIEPYAIFNRYGQPFTYFEGCDGAKADCKKLVQDIRSSLENDFCDVYVEVKVIARATQMDAVRRGTRLLSTFTTRFDSTKTDRVHNISLAAQKINGVVLENGGEFSFNGVVGQRTEENGFKSAKIIENGEFVDGIGGGVCQVSTTLFNCALLAGCDITEYHPHSLAVSYVPPSFDAMVSGTYFDLKFRNTTGCTLYIRAEATTDSITFNVYGGGDGASYSYSSVVKESIPAEEEYTPDESAVREGRDGIVSEGYLTINRNGTSKTVLFRRDKYAPIKRVVLEIAETKKEDSEQAESPENENNELTNN